MLHRRLPRSLLKSDSNGPNHIQTRSNPSEGVEKCSLNGIKFLFFFLMIEIVRDYLNTIHKALFKNGNMKKISSLKCIFPIYL